MNWGGPSFVIAIIAITTAGWVINNWIRPRPGYAPSDDRGHIDGSGQPEDGRTVQLLKAENEKLTDQVSRLEGRIAVPERIATDPTARTARAIDALNHR